MIINREDRWQEEGIYPSCNSVGKKISKFINIFPEKILFLLESLEPLKDIENRWDIPNLGRLPGHLGIFSNDLTWQHI